MRGNLVRAAHAAQRRKRLPYRLLRCAACAAWLPAWFLLLALCGTCRAGAEDPPVVGQPEHFNGAVGRFRITVAADPKQVQAEDPLTYTVRVVATGPVKQPPQRPALGEFTGFTDAFYIEDLGPPEGTRPDPQTWEFAYRLKPKSTAVKNVPGFPFVFFTPGFLPPRAGYMTAYAPPVSVTVTARREVVPKAITAPEAAFLLAGGDVLRPGSYDRLPGPLVLALAGLLPPIGCVAWCLVWRRLYPNAARLAHRRRSRAAQEALHHLRRIDRRTGREQQGQLAAAVVADYLRQRLGLSIIEPTPSEAGAHLCGQGVSEKLAGQAADLLRACAAARFDPGAPTDGDLAAAANGLILALEAETWSD
jgi:hypothetical protein